MRKSFLFPAALATAVATLPGAASATSTTCATTVVCAEFINTSSGVAIHGEANTGIGIRGTSVTNTGFYGASGSGKSTAPGVEGESTNASGSDVGGGFGLSFLAGKAAPSEGAVGYGSIYGLFGEVTGAGTSSSSAGYGVSGTDASAAGTFNAGVLGVSTAGIGALVEANGTPSLGVVGTEPIGLYAVAEPDSRFTSIAVLAESNSYPLEVHNTNDHTSVDLAQHNYLVSAKSNAGSFTVNDYGDGALSGTLTTQKGTYVRTAGGTGLVRTAYGTRSAAPEIEDVGEATLANGRAVVAIDAALADSIDMRRPYHVFITPEGDCNQLYVTQKTPAGFVVRESHDGRSTLTFDYRIVAKPLDESGARLALAAPLPRLPESAHLAAAAHLPAPLTVEARLKQQLGSQGYAKALEDLKARISGR